MRSGDKEEAGGGGEAGLTWTLYDVPLSRPRETLGGGAMPENQGSSLSNRESSGQRYTWDTCQREDVI